MNCRLAWHLHPLIWRNAQAGMCSTGLLRTVNGVRSDVGCHHRIPINIERDSQISLHNHGINRASENRGQSVNLVSGQTRVEWVPLENQPDPAD